MLNPGATAWMVSIGVMVFGASVVSAQNFPSRPLRIVCGQAGSSSDVTARLLAQGITGSLGQPVIVDNRGAGVFTAELVAESAPDGHTMLVGGGAFWLFPLLQKTSYDVVRDFSPITLAVSQPNLLVVNSSVPAKSVKELIALAKARPGELNYSAGPIGSSGHLAGELFKAMAGVHLVNIPFKGTGQAVAAVLAGEVQVTLSTASSVMQHVTSGKLTALAVGSAQPSALFPGLPTVAATVPGYESVAILGVFARARTQEAIIKRLNYEMVRFLKSAEGKEKFLALGAEAIGNSPAELAAAVRKDMSRYGKLIKDLGIRAE